MQSPSQEERASHDLAERQATEELPNFLPYAAVDSTDEFEERCARPVLASSGLLIAGGTAAVHQPIGSAFLPELTALFVLLRSPDTICERRRTACRGHHEELRCVLAVVRHGDRTPKQKMKMKVTQEPLLRLLATHLDAKGKQAKLKSPSELQELLDVTRALLADMDAERRAPAAPGGSPPGLGGLKLDADLDELREKFGIVRVRRRLCAGHRPYDDSQMATRLLILGVCLRKA